MAVDKKISYEVQGGAKNYLGKQKQVTAPLKWKSSPDSPETELAYITKAEKDLLVKKDLHGSLKGDVNRGPSGIMSLDGYGSFDDPSDKSRDTGMSGAATSAAESGRNTSDTLAEGASYRDVQDYRDAFIAAGGGQRVNPGFFDSKNIVSPDELARARASNPAAFKAGRRGGIMDFFTGGGFLGNIIRGLGQKFGLGKTFDEPTYDMRRFSATNPTFQNDLGNEFALANTTNQIPVVIDDDMSLIPRRNLNDYEGVTSDDGIITIPMDKPQDQSMDNFFKDAMAKVTKRDIATKKMGMLQGQTYENARDLGLINPDMTEFEFNELQKGNITKAGTYIS
jgi:hypothetical protein|tara:strand:+ start:5946 stop:6959 length:1014 start_codon:yes stop_codon:yes gene_type:complete